MTSYRRKSDCRFDTLPPSPWKTALIQEIQRDNARLKRRKQWIELIRWAFLISAVLVTYLAAMSVFISAWMGMTFAQSAYRVPLSMVTPLLAAFTHRF